MGPGRRCHHPGGGGSRSTWRESGTGEASSSGQRRLAVHREGGRDRGGVVILRAAEARGPPGGSSRVGPGRRRHSPGGGCSRSTGREGGSRSTGREGGTGEVSPSSGRRRLAVHREGGWHRRGVILRAVEARGPLGGRGGSRSTCREGGTGEVSPSSGRRRLAVHREGGWDRRGVILRAAEALGPPGGRVGPGRCRNPPGGGGSWSTGRESGSGEALSSGRWMLAVHWEGGEARGPPVGRAGPGRRRHPPGGGGSRSTGRELEGGTGEASSFSGRWMLAVHWEGGEARGPPVGRVGPGRCRHHPGGGGSRSTGREGGTGEASSSGRRRLAVHREGGEARGPPRGRVGPGRRRHPPGVGGSRSTGREGGTGEVSSSSGRRRLAVHREGGWDRGVVVILQAAEARGPPGGRVGPGRCCHPPCRGGSRSTGREGLDRGGVIVQAAEAAGPQGGRVGLAISQCYIPWSRLCRPPIHHHQNCHHKSPTATTCHHCHWLHY